MDEESEAQREETVTSDQEEGGRMVPSSLPPGVCPPHKLCALGKSLLGLI